MTRPAWFAAALVALGAGGVAYLYEPAPSGRCEDVEIVLDAPDDAGILRPVQRAYRLCSAGDAGVEIPGQIVWRSPAYAKPAGASPVALAVRNEMASRGTSCACGPRIKPNSCRITHVLPEGTEVRESQTGEVAQPGRWAGNCVPSPCVTGLDPMSGQSPLPLECR